jgi:hypothetical protein
MIGVLCGDEEREVASEFFELFKTPWQFWSPGREYDVLISTRPQDPQVRARLIIVFASGDTELDRTVALSIQSSSAACAVDRTGARIPLYGRRACLLGPGAPLLHDASHTHVLGLRLPGPRGSLLRIGYDLFREVAFLLSEGQPVENGSIPALDLHISLLRTWILEAGIPLVEIPPVPYGHRFMACLTHDVDFAGIRRHKLDHTLFGFLYRATIGSLIGLWKGTGSVGRLLRNWAAVFSLPLVYLGILDDFWAHFDAYTGLEGGAPSTFFLIPFKHRAGDRVQAPSPARRAAPYDVDDVQEQARALIDRGCEIGLHGIDAWHSLGKGKQELDRVARLIGRRDVGVRMHWLCFDHASPAVLDQCGFDYDATCGYNEAPGYRAGTTQVFRPCGATRLLELPLHIQDTALFYPRRLGLTDAQAWKLCEAMLDEAARSGGVLTVSWHERSLAPERLWGTFYVQLLQQLRARGAWFGSGHQVVQWFRARRCLRWQACEFSGSTLRLSLDYQAAVMEPHMVLRVHRPLPPQAAGSRSAPPYVDVPYAGESRLEITLD